MDNQIKYAMFTALADAAIEQFGAKGEDTSLAKKDRKAWARYQTRIREIEIAAEERATGKKHRSRKRSRSGRRKKR